MNEYTCETCGGTFDHVHFCLGKSQQALDGHKWSGESYDIDLLNHTYEKQLRQMDFKSKFHNDLTKIIEFAVDANPPTLSQVVDKLCELRGNMKNE